jgi:hypothetical protein
VPETEEVDTSNALVPESAPASAPAAADAAEVKAAEAELKNAAATLKLRQKLAESTTPQPNSAAHVKPATHVDKALTPTKTTAPPPANLPVAHVLADQASARLKATAAPEVAAVPTAAKKAAKKVAKKAAKKVAKKVAKAAKAAKAAKVAEKMAKVAEQKAKHTTKKADTPHHAKTTYYTYIDTYELTAGDISSATDLCNQSLSLATITDQHSIDATNPSSIARTPILSSDLSCEDLGYTENETSGPQDGLLAGMSVYYN